MVDVRENVARRAHYRRPSERDFRIGKRRRGKRRRRDKLNLRRRRNFRRYRIGVVGVALRDDFERIFRSRRQARNFVGRLRTLVELFVALVQHITARRVLNRVPLDSNRRERALEIGLKLWRGKLRLRLRRLLAGRRIGGKVIRSVAFSDKREFVNGSRLKTVDYVARRGGVGYRRRQRLGGSLLAVNERVTGRFCGVRVAVPLDRNRIERASAEGYRRRRELIERLRLGSNRLRRNFRIDVRVLALRDDRKRIVGFWIQIGQFELVGSNRNGRSITFRRHADVVLHFVAARAGNGIHSTRYRIFPARQR